MLYFILFFIIIVLGGVHCSIYKGSYSVSNISYLNSHLHYSLLNPLLIFGTNSTGIIFAFTCMCIHYLHHVHPPTHFPTTFSMLYCRCNTNIYTQTHTSSETDHSVFFFPNNGQCVFCPFLLLLLTIEQNHLC
jgi:hypothetical protein